MSNPAFAFTSPEIMSKLASIKPYVLVVLTKGENYGLSDTPRIIQSEHLPYIFEQRRDNEMVLTMPIMDNETNLAAVAIYNTKDKERVLLRTSLIREVYKQLSTAYLSKKKTLALVKA